MTLLEPAPPLAGVPHLECAVLRPTVRLVAPTDTAALAAFGRRCSTESLYHRFLSPMTSMPAAHLDDVVAGRGDMMSVVAQSSGGMIVGLATLAPSRHGPPELAVIVEDAWQRRGIGRALVRDLVERARRQGLREIAVVAASTRPFILRWLAPIGPFRHQLDGPVIEAVFEIS